MLFGALRGWMSFISELDKYMTSLDQFEVLQFLE